MTRYEVTLEHPDHGKFLLVYAGRKSRHALITDLRTRYHLITQFLGYETRMWRNVGEAAAGLMCNEGWKIRYSGRTQRDAETEGELQWFREATLPTQS